MNKAQGNQRSVCLLSFFLNQCEQFRTLFPRFPSNKFIQLTLQLVATRLIYSTKHKTWSWERGFVLAAFINYCLLHLPQSGIYNLKGRFTQNWKFCHYLLPFVPMEGQVKFFQSTKHSWSFTGKRLCSLLTNNYSKWWLGFKRKKNS